MVTIAIDPIGSTASRLGRERRDDEAERRAGEDDGRGRQEQQPRLAAERDAEEQPADREQQDHLHHARPGSAPAASRRARCSTDAGMARRRSSVPQSRSSSRPSETPSSMPRSRNVTLKPGTFWSNVLMVRAAAADVALLDAERARHRRRLGRLDRRQRERRRLRQRRRGRQLDRRGLGLRERGRCRRAGSSARPAARGTRAAAGSGRRASPPAAAARRARSRSRGGAPSTVSRYARTSASWRSSVARRALGALAVRVARGLQLARDRVLARARAARCCSRSAPCHAAASRSLRGARPRRGAARARARPGRARRPPRCARWRHARDASASRSSSRRTPHVQALEVLDRVGVERRATPDVPRRAPPASRAG